MNTHDKIELPSLPDLPAYPAEVFDREVKVVSETMVEQLMQDYAREAIEADRQRRGEPVELDRYDAGFLGGQDGMPAYVWHDIIRAELDRAYDFYMDQLDRAAPQPAEPTVKESLTAPDGWQLVPIGLTEDMSKAELIDLIEQQQQELEAIGAGGVSGKLMR